MTEQEILEGNKLIAEFMGAELKTTSDCFVEGKLNKWAIFKEHPNQLIRHVGRTFKDDDLRYRTSWDWLMPVVEKIELMQYDTKIGCLSKISNGVATTDQIVVIETPTGNEISCIEGKESKIEAVYLAVVSFINWHNQTTTDKGRGSKK